MSVGYTGLVIGFHVRRGWFNKLHIYLCETYENYDGRTLTSKWYKAKTLKFKSKFAMLRQYLTLKKEYGYIPTMCH